MLSASRRPWIWLACIDQLLSGDIQGSHSCYVQDSRIL